MYYIVYADPSVSLRYAAVALEAAMKQAENITKPQKDEEGKEGEKEGGKDSKGKGRNKRVSAALHLLTEAQLYRDKTKMNRRDLLRFDSHWKTLGIIGPAVNSHTNSDASGGGTNWNSRD